MSTLEAPTYLPYSATGGGRPPRRILLGMMVAVFFSGGVIGSGSTLMLVNNRIKENEKPVPIVDWNRRIVSELEAKLSLSEEQTKQVDQIMKEHLAALDKLRREDFSPKIREQFKQMEDQVNAVLDGQQSTQWHAWLEERRKRVCPTSGRGHGGSSRAGKGSGGASASTKVGSQRRATEAAASNAKPDATSDRTQ